jgi:hypothetical protein
MRFMGGIKEMAGTGREILFQPNLTQPIFLIGLTRLDKKASNIFYLLF